MAGTSNIGTRNLKLNVADAKRVAASSVELVDLSKTATVAKIVRQGFDVPAVTFDPRKVEQFIGGLDIVIPKDVPRVVSQSIATGTKVAKGTVVDLVLAPRTKIPFEIFPNLHLDLATKKLADFEMLLTDSTVKKTLLTYDSPDIVPISEKENLKTQFLRAGITVDETNPGKTFDKAFQSVRNAMAFQ